MSNELLAYATLLRLSRRDIADLRVTDTYSLHRVVYDLFNDIRSEEEKKQGKPSGILWVDKGGDFHYRSILILSNRLPRQAFKYGEVQTKAIRPDFLTKGRYGFEVVLNPTRRISATGKIEPISDAEAIRQWAVEKARENWGFEIDSRSLQVSINPVVQFSKNCKTATYHSVTLKGVLTVVDGKSFEKSFTHGMGRGKAFGFGFLQLMPLSNNY